MDCCQDVPQDVWALLRFTMENVDMYFRGIRSLWLDADLAERCISACQNFTDAWLYGCM